MSRDLFAEVGAILTEMGGPGSGHHGHKGRKGKRGGSAPSKAGGISSPQPVGGAWSSWHAFEVDVIQGNIDPDFSIQAEVDNTLYEVKLESWWEGCMESRGLGKTSWGSIDRRFEELMAAEAGWDRVDISGFIDNTHIAPYGATYIGRKVLRVKSDFIISQVESQLVLSPEGGWVEKGGPGSGHWGHAGRKGKRGGSLPGAVGVLGAAVVSQLEKDGYDPGILVSIGRDARDRGFTSLLGDLHDEVPENEYMKYADAYAEARLFTSGGFSGQSDPGFRHVSLKRFERDLANPERRWIPKQLAAAAIIKSMVEQDLRSTPRLYRGSDWEGSLSVGDKVDFGTLGREFSSLSPAGGAFGARKYTFILDNPQRGANLKNFSNHPEEKPWLIKGNYKVSSIKGKNITIVPGGVSKSDFIISQIESQLVLSPEGGWVEDVLVSEQRVATSLSSLFE